MPQFCTVLVSARIQEKETDIPFSELDVDTAHLSNLVRAEYLFNAELEICELGGFKWNNKKLMCDRAMNTGNGVTEEDYKNLLGAHIEKGSQCNLGLVRECLGLIKYDDFGTGGGKEGIKGRAHEGVDATADSLEAAFIAGVEEEGATEETRFLGLAAAPLTPVYGLHEISRRGRFSRSWRAD